jgi:hypothetical protein
MKVLAALGFIRELKLDRSMHFPHLLGSWLLVRPQEQMADRRSKRSDIQDHYDCGIIREFLNGTVDAFRICVAVGGFATFHRAFV